MYFSNFTVLVLRVNHLPESQQMRQKYSVVDSYSSPGMQAAPVILIVSLGMHKMESSIHEK